MANKNITITEPTPSMDGVKCAFERVGGEWICTVTYSPNNAPPFTKVFNDSQIPTAFKNVLTDVLTRALNAAKAEWGF